MARRSRRRSNRSTAGLVLAGILILVLGGLAINGVIKGASDSQSYLELVNRSFVTQANVIVAHQQVQSDELHRILVRAPKMSRRELAGSLEALMVSTQADAKAAENSLPPNPTGQLGQRFVHVIEERAIAVHVIGLTIERLLGIAVTPPGATTPKVRPLLTTSVATARLSGAGAALVRADRQVGPLRYSFAHAPGHSQLHRSVFVPDRSLVSATAMAGLVSELEASSTLAIVHQLELSSVSLRPAALPTSTSSTTNLPPATSLRVTALLQNAGTVTEPGIVVTASLTPVNGGKAASVSARGTAQPGGSLALALPAMALSPGTTVTLKVTVSTPPGQTDATALTQTFTLVVAPATPNFG
jgi:hypothetical protein